MSSHAGVADAWDRLISGVCDFVCVCVCVRVRDVRVRALKENGLSYQHQTWHNILYGSRSEVKKSRSRSHGYENRHGRVVASGRCGRYAISAGVGLGLHVGWLLRFLVVCMHSSITCKALSSRYRIADIFRVAHIFRVRHNNMGNVVLVLTCVSHKN